MSATRQAMRGGWELNASIIPEVGHRRVGELCRAAPLVSEREKDISKFKDCFSL